MKKVKEINKNEVRIDGRLYRAVEEPKLELKILAWYVFESTCEFIVFRATSRANNYFHDDEGNMFQVTLCRIASEKEIEAHLIKVAKGKGYKEGVNIDYHGNIRTIHGCLKYLPVWGYGCTALAFGNDIIWRSDEGWFEILPAKKKLPVTIAEFNKFLGDWTENINYLPFPLATDEFLNGYE